MNLRVELNHLSYPEESEAINDADGKECTDFHLVDDSNVSFYFILS